MSKAIRELERKKREEERLRLMRKYYEKPKAPPYAPPLLSKGSSNPITPAVKRMIETRLISAINSEKEDAKFYIDFAEILKREGLMEEANIIARLSASEVGHEEELKAMLARFRLERMIR